MKVEDPLSLRHIITIKSAKASRIVRLAIEDEERAHATDRQELADMRDLVEKFRKKWIFRPDYRMELYDTIDTLNEWERRLDEARATIAKNKQEHEDFIARGGT